MTIKTERGKLAAMKAASAKYPKLDAVLKEIELTSHTLELADGRHAYTKYLEPIYRNYLKSKERGTTRRDRTRICKLRGLKVRNDVCLLGVSILGTSKVSKSTRGKYVGKLREADEEGIAPEDLRDFLKRPKAAKCRKRRLSSIAPRLPVPSIALRKRGPLIAPKLRVV
ncbi:hypothetical protein AAFG13_18230 [Bradyrhizobium sp. B124]|uniref:hypothetical protein n=1 Tax=Bradyrhizobium sp. B124 TaxID=3140245 RepID=UPI0031838CBC